MKVDFLWTTYVCLAFLFFILPDNFCFLMETVFFYCFYLIWLFIWLGINLPSSCCFLVSHALFVHFFLLFWFPLDWVFLLHILPPLFTISCHSFCYFCGCFRLNTIHLYLITVCLQVVLYCLVYGIRISPSYISISPLQLLCCCCHFVHVL